MEGKLKNWSAYFSLVFLGFLTANSAGAQQLNDADCEALGHTIEVLAQQNLRVQEIRRDFAMNRFEALLDEATTGSAQFAAEGQAIQEMLDAMDALEFEASEIVPGIIVFRRLCRDG
jgi:hypothetical protein